MRRQTDLRSLVREGVGLHINCLEILAVYQASQFFLHHVLVLSDSRSVVSYINHQGGLVTLQRPSCVGSDQSALTEGEACAGQDEPWSRHVVKEQCLLRGMDASPARVSENLGSLWQSSSRPLRRSVRGSPTIPLRWNLLSQANGMPWHPACASYGPCMCGHSTGAIRPPRACLNHDGRS